MLNSIHSILEKNRKFIEIKIKYNYSSKVHYAHFSIEIPNGHVDMQNSNRDWGSYHLTILLSWCDALKFAYPDCISSTARMKNYYFPINCRSFFDDMTKNLEHTSDEHSTGATRTSSQEMECLLHTRN